ncbi:hypothetical protein D3C73_950870 [compost metagenome]
MLAVRGDGECAAWCQHEFVRIALSVDSRELEGADFAGYRRSVDGACLPGTDNPHCSFTGLEDVTAGIGVDGGCTVRECACLNQLLEGIYRFNKGRIFKGFLAVKHILEEARTAVRAEQNIHEQEGTGPGVLLPDRERCNALLLQNLHILQHFFEGGRGVRDARLLEQLLVIVDDFNVIAVRQRIHIAVKAVIIQQPFLVGILQTVLVEHIVQRSEQSCIDKRLHLRSRVHNCNIRHFLGSGLCLQLHFLLVGVQGIQLNFHIRMLLHVLVGQLMNHFVSRCGRVRIDVLEGKRNLLAAVRGCGSGVAAVSALWGVGVSGCAFITVVVRIAASRQTQRHYCG